MALAFVLWEGRGRGRGRRLAVGRTDFVVALKSPPLGHSSSRAQERTPISHGIGRGCIPRQQRRRRNQRSLPHGSTALAIHSYIRCSWSGSGLPRQGAGRGVQSRFIALARFSFFVLKTSLPVARAGRCPVYGEGLKRERNDSRPVPTNKPRRFP